MIEILKDFVKDNADLLLMEAFMFAAGFGLGAGIMDAIISWKGEDKDDKA